ncbi:hypothetical protein Q604_UNBC15398G0001, partial [human gut metagenome]
QLVHGPRRDELDGVAPQPSGDLELVVAEGGGARLELVAEKDEPARVWTLTAAEPGEVEVSVSVRRQGGWSTPVNRRVTVR